MSNPFAALEFNDPPVQTEGKFRLKRIGVLSFGFFLGLGGALLGVLFSVYGIVMTHVMLRALAGPVAISPMRIFVMIPIFYGVGGFVGGILWALLYNLVAGMTGGIKLELKRDWLS